MYHRNYLWETAMDFWWRIINIHLGQKLVYDDTYISYIAGESKPLRKIREMVSETVLNNWKQIWISIKV